MKAGDLVEVLYEHDLGLVMSEPELSKDCLPGGDAEYEHYYLLDVLFPRGLVSTDYDDIARVVSEAG